MEKSGRCAGAIAAPVDSARGVDLQARPTGTQGKIGGFEALEPVGDKGMELDGLVVPCNRP